MISYYELLGMIKKGNIPDKVEYDNEVYTWNDDCYTAGSLYLAERFLEVQMFDDTIKIIENNKYIEKLSIPRQESAIANDYSKDNIQCIVNEFYRRFNVLINKTNEIIEVLNEKEEV